MPLDPSIALGVHPPQIPSPIQSIGQIMQVKGAMQESALRNLQMQHQEIQNRELVNAEHARMEQEGQTRDLQSMIAKNADFNKAITEASATGRFNPMLLDKVQKEHADTVKSIAAMGVEKLTQKKAALSSIGDTMAGIAALPPDQQATEYVNARGRLLADPTTAGDAATLPEMYDKAAVDSYKWKGPLAMQMLEAAGKQQELEAKKATALREQQKFDTEHPADVAKAAATAAVANATAKDPQLLTPEQRATETRAEGNVDEAKLALRAAKGTRPGATPAEVADGQIANLALKRMTADKVAARPLTQIVQPQYKDGKLVVSPTAQMAAEGRLDPVTLRAVIRKNPTIVAEIKQAAPDWDEADIEKRYQVGKEMSSTSNTKGGGQAIALNTLVHHADLYLQSAEALKNGTFKPGNAAYNAVASLFGSAPPQNAALVARFLAGETGKVATGGVPAEGEIKGVLANLPNDASPDQIAGAGKTILQIAAGRAIPLMEKVKDAKLEKTYPILGADAREILGRRGFDPDTLKPRAAAPSGGGAPSGMIRARDANGNLHEAKAGTPLPAGWKAE